MVKLVWKVSLAMALLTVALVGAARAVPIDQNHIEELRAFLFPPACETPCLMGIRPGVTTFAEAEAVLDATGWVRQKDFTIFSAESATINWLWNKRTFPYFTDRPTSSFYTQPNSITLFNGIVTSVRIETNLTHGEAMLMMGQSDQTYYLSGYSMGASAGDFVGLYDRLTVRTNVMTLCPPYYDSLLRAPTALELRANVDSDAGMRIFGTQMSSRELVIWLRSNAPRRAC
jgi:hypothetical protein